MRTRSRKPGMKRYATAFASAYAPTARRHQWLIVARCPFCGSGHHHRVPKLRHMSGVHRPSCRPGAAYWVVVARQYDAAAAEKALEQVNEYATLF